MVCRTSIQRTFAETERGYQGLPPERVVYTRNLLRVYIAVVPVGVHLENGKYPTLRLFFVRFDIDIA